MINAIRKNKVGKGIREDWRSQGCQKVAKVSPVHTHIQRYLEQRLGFPGGSDRKESACHAGVAGSVPGTGGFLGEGNGNPLQYPCLEYSMDRGAWRATVHETAKSLTRLSDFHTHLAKT